jgi:hypothetical protein
MLDEIKKASNFTKAIILLMSLVMLMVLILNVKLQSSQQYSDLAQSFLHGHLYFLHSIGGVGQDPVYFHGRTYWSEGVFPAIVLMPFVAIFSIFHTFFLQNYICWFLVLIIWFLVYKLAGFIGYKKQDSVLLAFAFTLASAFMGIAAISSSWYVAQSITTLLLFWSLYEYFRPGGTRWWLIGLICGMILLTRPTAAPIVIFFLLEALNGKKNHLKKHIQLLAPIAIAIVLTGLYNTLRFKSPFNGGYTAQVLGANSIASEKEGLFSLVHVPTNLYSLVLGTPVPVLRNNVTWTLKFPYIKNNVYGMSMFITSPYYLYLLMRKPKNFNKQTIHLLSAALVSGIFILTYFGIGVFQFGCRYSLDFLPELFMVFMIIYKKNNTQLSTGMKFLFLASSLFNIYIVSPAFV